MALCCFAGRSQRRGLTDVDSLRGEELFRGWLRVVIGLHGRTGTAHPYAELRNQMIHPYTDMLLHDMGEGLADTLGEGEVQSQEWRTAPLWGIGLTSGVSGGEAYLHDGRARTLAEAILWHGGEGEAAKENSRSMPADRDALIQFEDPLVLACIVELSRSMRQRCSCSHRKRLLGVAYNHIEERDDIEARPVIGILLLLEGQESV